MKQRKSKKFWNSIYDNLYSIYGECACPLLHDSPFQLLVAVMLSAQCRDERVNQVTRELFSIAPDAKAMAELPIEKLSELIHPCGLFANKSRNIRATAQMIIKDFNGEVPHTMEELTRLPGVGRKSANVILGNAFNLPGFPVDTHVNRLLNRIGAVKDSNPEHIESAACAEIPPEKWCNFSHLLIQHGRNICPARSPKCAECTLNTICEQNGVIHK